MPTQEQLNILKYANCGELDLAFNLCAAIDWWEGVRLCIWVNSGDKLTESQFIILSQFANKVDLYAVKDLYSYINNKPAISAADYLYWQMFDLDINRLSSRIDGYFNNYKDAKLAFNHYCKSCLSVNITNELKQSILNEALGVRDYEFVYYHSEYELHNDEYVDFVMTMFCSRRDFRKAILYVERGVVLSKQLNLFYVKTLHKDDFKHICGNERGYDTKTSSGGSTAPISNLKREINLSELKEHIAKGTAIVQNMHVLERILETK